MELKIDLSNGDKMEFLAEDGLFKITKWDDEVSEWEEIILCRCCDIRKIISALNFIESEVSNDAL